MDFLSRSAVGERPLYFSLYADLRDLETRTKHKFLQDFGKLVELATSEQKYELFFVLLLIADVATDLLIQNLQPSELEKFSQQAIADYDTFYEYYTYPSQTRETKFCKAFTWSNLEYLLSEKSVLVEENTMVKNCERYLKAN